MNIDVANYIQNKRISDFDDAVKNAMFDKFDKNPEIREIMNNIEHYRDIVKTYQRNNI